MAQPKSRSQKRKAGGPETPPALQIGSTDDDRVIFMLIDWKSEQSIRNHIPVLHGLGQINKIPKVWLAIDDNPRGIVLRAKLWRCLSKKEQEDQTEKMQKVNKNAQQMKQLKGNLDVLEVCRKELLQGDAKWDDTAEEPTTFIDSLTDQRLRAAAGANTMSIIAADIKGFFAKRGLAPDTNQSQKKSRTTATPPPTTTNTTTPALPPPQPPQVTAEENQDPNPGIGNAEMSGGPTILFTTRASDPALRIAEAEQVEKSAVLPASGV